MLFLALLPAKRKTARFAFRAAKPGLCPALRGLLFALVQANPERSLEQHGEAGMRTSHLHPSFPKQAQRAPAGNGQPRRQVTDGMRRARTTNRAVFLSPCHGRILKSPGKASKINDFTKHKGAYYATFESALM